MILLIQDVDFTTGISGLVQLNALPVGDAFILGNVTLSSLEANFGDRAVVGGRLETLTGDLVLNGRTIQIKSSANVSHGLHSAGDIALTVSDGIQLQDLSTSIDRIVRMSGVNITFNGTVESDAASSTPFASLDLTSTGGVVFAGNVGGLRPLGDVGILANDVSIDGLFNIDANTLTIARSSLGSIGLGARLVT